MFGASATQRLGAGYLFPRPWKRQHYDFPKRREKLAQRHSVTPQKNRILSNTVVRISEFAEGPTPVTSIGGRWNAPFKLQNTALCPLKNRTNEVFRGNTLKGNCMSAVLVGPTALATEPGGGVFCRQRGTQALCFSITCTFVFYSMNKEQEKTGQKNRVRKSVS